MQSRYNNLEQWLRWQETLHFKRIDLGLDRIQIVARRLNIQSIADKVVLVGGTNGKGSCVSFLQQLYLASGYRVACYTSPHLLRYNERFSLLGKLASDESLIEAFTAIDNVRQDISLTYFEFATLAAFYLFARLPLDIALVEVGMGGRLDATNIINADVSVITSIGLDHRAWLGETREAIGHEKSGIMRPGQPVVCGDRLLPDSVVNAADNNNALISRIGIDFDCKMGVNNWDWYSDGNSLRKLPLPAGNSTVQLANIATAIQVASHLQSCLPVTRPAIVRAITDYSLPGRCQLLQKAPEVWLDVAHNPQAMHALVDTLASQEERRSFVVLGLLADKDIEEIVRILEPIVAGWYLATPKSERSLDVATLQRIVQANSRQPVTSYPDVAEAFNSAVSMADDSARVVVTGSFFTVAEIMAMNYSKRL